MPYLSGIHEIFNVAAYRAAEFLWRAVSVQSEIPAPLRAIRDSFHQVSFKPGWFGYVLLVIAHVTIGLVAWHWWRSRRLSNQIAHRPDQLFDSLLGELELTETERRLLREMTGGARLIEPAMCLMSPGMLDWAWSAWRTERGPGIATVEKHEQLDRISKKLFDHVTPSTAAAK